MHFDIKAEFMWTRIVNLSLSPVKMTNEYTALKSNGLVASVCCY